MNEASGLEWWPEDGTAKVSRSHGWAADRSQRKGAISPSAARVWGSRVNATRWWALSILSNHFLVHTPAFVCLSVKGHLSCFLMFTPNIVSIAILLPSTWLLTWSWEVDDLCSTQLTKWISWNANLIRLFPRLKFLTGSLLPTALLLYCDCTLELLGALDKVWEAQPTSRHSDLIDQSTELSEL